MGKKAWKWTGKRIVLLAAVILLAVFCVWWLRPRSVESLVGAPVGGVGQAVLEEGLGDGKTDVSGGLEELYGFSFTRPVFSPTLQYEGRSYDLALAVGDRWQYWTLTDDGVLWDGIRPVRRAGRPGAACGLAVGADRLRGEKAA